MHNSFTTIYDSIHISITLSIYILRGIAYKALLGNYMGFIPIFGDIVCKYQIGKEYDNPFNKHFLITTLLLFSLPFFSIILFFSAILFIADVYKKWDSFLWIIFSIFLFAVIIIVISIFWIYYSYKIIYPLVQDITQEENVEIRTFIFAIFPLVFFIWIIIKNRNAKKKL